MQISALTKFSLIDFPGQVACIVFTPGCNFRCEFCHNSEFVLPEKLSEVYKNLIPITSFFEFLEKRKGLLTGVSICGGEPTMQKGLLEFCRKIKEMGFLVKLDTNGRDPEILKELLDKGLVDYVATDIKNKIGSLSDLAGVNVDEKIYLQSIRVLLDSEVDYEFRTTVIKGVHDEHVIENIAKYITTAKAYYLQNYKGGNTLNPDFKGQSFTEGELEKFKQIATQYIKNVGIRE
ncbi:MAG: anaerobic ribonucleoside-triphosphate reductase activating protein [Candidatus Gracilibacteria bacterium]|nr:anaerobic ribonucleoside-triphosphate reductase activating protein [Candidatus Gracilibacteria bacterium]